MVLVGGAFIGSLIDVGDTWYTTWVFAVFLGTLAGADLRYWWRRRPGSVDGPAPAPLGDGGSDVTEEETSGHRAADHGMPRLRVRRLPDQDGKRRRRRRYEVELTEPGAERPAWTRETSDPVLVIDPFLGVADAHAVVSAADRAWQGGNGPWESLFPGDRVAQDEVPGADAPEVPDPGR